MSSKADEIRRAVAMVYGADDAAPRVVARGSGVTAEAIISLARESGVYVHRSRELVNLLMQVDLDCEIPPELYRAVAELLIWLHGLDEKMLSHKDSSSR